MNNVSAVFLVAGMSKRFGGKNKALSLVGKKNESLLEISLNRVIKSGVSKIILVCNVDNKPVFKEKFGNEYKGLPIFYAIQNYDKEKRTRPWGTLDAICSAFDLIDDLFIVCNSDDLYSEKSISTLVMNLKSHRSNAVIGFKLGSVLQKDKGVNRSVFNVKNGKVVSIKEYFDITLESITKEGLSLDSYCNMNLIGFNKYTLGLLRKKLDDFKMKNLGDREIECILSDVLTSLFNEGELIINFYPSDDKCLGITNPEDEAIVKEELLKED